ncbi:MAG: hypothetical protein JO257_31260 [Deltaproteobacteria bacterium]|nr:hypothetical protein [Deltaproteobacteria bacterium]
MRVLLLIGAGAIGCSSGPKQLGKVTEDGIAAVHEWCGDKLEIESHIDMPSGKPMYPNATNLLVLHCIHAKDGGGLGWVARDSQTNQLIGTTFSVPPALFDGLVDRVIVPALDADARSRLATLRAFMRAPGNEHMKVSEENGIRLIVGVYAGPEWFISVYHD